MLAFPRQGLYVITAPSLAQPEVLEQQLRLALAGGARVVQYRDKTHDAPGRRAAVEGLLGICRPAGVALIINDDVELALATGADGVHLGKDDFPLAEARARLGPKAIIGVSCYNRLDLATQAAAQGADYVAFGRFFPSATKPQAVAAQPALLTAARAQLSVPIVAIGGITLENGGTLLAAGADLLAVIGAVFGAADIQATCTDFSLLFPTQEDSTT